MASTLTTAAERVAASVGAGVAAVILILCIAQVAYGDALVGTHAFATHAQFAMVEQAYSLGEAGLIVNRSALTECDIAALEIPPQVTFCTDSGCTTICISEHDEWMLSEVTDLDRPRTRHWS